MKYKTELITIFMIILLCISVFFCIKRYFFTGKNINSPIESVVKYYNEEPNDLKYAQATTKPIITTKSNFKTISVSGDEESVVDEKVSEIEDDGSIIFDGMTVSELTNKLNKSLNSYIANTGYYYADFTRKTGMDPYLTVAITLLETGCNGTCNSWAVRCNNFGGLIGLCYPTLEEGMNGYLNILYNNYYLKGLTTSELIGTKYAPGNSQWANKVNNYYNQIKAK